jgi:phosphoribosylamine---glycine ligase
MNLLVIGSGGREHALVWKLHQSPRVDRIYCAPGNAGISELAELVPLQPDDIHGLRRFAEQEQVDLTVVGPELPLSLGIVDEFEAHGLRVFGPNKQAAQLEVSKAFAKDLMRREQVPTAYFGSFTDPDEARRYVDEVGTPIVVKADGLAAGKGVIICTTAREAHEAIDEIMRGRIFGNAGDRVVVEEFLEGEEASFLAFTDGHTVLPLSSAQDHKRVFDEDQGPNTGGMGAYSPAPIVTPALTERVMQEVMYPIVTGLQRRGIIYKGILYAGLMIQNNHFKVLEFNVRFGDPECQPLMLRLKTDLVDVIEAVLAGRLADIALAWDERPAICVVLTAGGYPGKYDTGHAITGLESLRDWKDGVVFHAGTALSDHQYVTKGGRVLGVTATGVNIQGAISAAYAGVQKITWAGMHYRRDIGQRAVSHSKVTGDR